MAIVLGGRRCVVALRRTLRFLALASLVSSLAPFNVAAAERKRTPVSEIVVDARSGRTVFATDADRPRPPASLAKVMVLLLTFDALAEKRLRLTDNLVMTARGERQAPSRLGLARGRSMRVDAAIKVVAVISANDVAVALAERLGGSEAGFVAAMNRRAAAIGMTRTRFGNATGLAPGAGLTTSRDMATLAHYLLRRYPDRYKLFGTRSIRWKRWVRPNHNQLLGKVKGLDGIKTGYTVPAGFNLSASARRGDRRMIVVVMGAPTAAARDLLVANLMEAGFSAPVAGQGRAAPRPLVRPLPKKSGGSGASERRGDQRREGQGKAKDQPRPGAAVRIRTQVEGPPCRRDPPRAGARRRPQPDAARPVPCLPARAAR